MSFIFDRNQFQNVALIEHYVISVETMSAAAAVVIAANVYHLHWLIRNVSIENVCLQFGLIIEKCYL